MNTRRVCPEIGDDEWRELLGRAAMCGYALSRTGPSRRGRFRYGATHGGVHRDIGHANNIRVLVDIVTGALPLEEADE